MPKFIMPFNNAENIRAFNALSAFTQGYVEAMFFTSTGTGDDEDLETATFDDLAPETVAKIVSDCAAFERQAESLLFEAYEREYDDIQAGRDFWFTRNGHGVGYWAREDLDSGELGEALSTAAKSFGGIDLSRGDDVKIYLS